MEMSGPVGGVDVGGLLVERTGPGLLHVRMGMPHDVGCIAGKCRFYVNSYYHQYIGTILTDGWAPAGQTWRHYAIAILSLLGKFYDVADEVDLFLSDTTFTAGRYAYDGTVYFEKTRVFTYTCGTHFANARWESTKTKHLHFFFTAHGFFSMANLNVVLPGSGYSSEKTAEAVKHWDEFILDHLLDSLAG